MTSHNADITISIVPLFLNGFLVTRPSSSASNPKRQLSEAPASRGGEENSNLAATVTVTESTPVENKESKESGNAKGKFGAWLLCLIAPSLTPHQPGLPTRTNLPTKLPTYRDLLSDLMPWRAPDSNKNPTHSNSHSATRTVPALLTATPLLVVQTRPLPATTPYHLFPHSRALPLRTLLNSPGLPINLFVRAL